MLILEQNIFNITRRYKVIDKNDFIIKEYKSNQRKNGKAKHKLYRIICDICKEPQGYGCIRTVKGKAKGKNYCRKCHYERMSEKFSKQIVGKCKICGKIISRAKLKKP